MRMPYWDAFASPNLPVAVSVPSITVNTPNGSQALDNPLYNFTFHQNEGGNRFPPENWV
jgi:hypothetical protein